MTPHLKQLGEHLEYWLQTQNVTQVELGSWLDVSQAQMSRVVHARLGERSTAVNVLFSFLNQYSAPPAPDRPTRAARTTADLRGQRALPAALADAVQEAWNGTADDAERLAGLLRAAGAYRRARRGPARRAASTPTLRDVG